MSALIWRIPLENRVESLNRTDTNGFTLLHCACALGYYSVVVQLLRCGADVNLPDQFNFTPFDWAVNRDDPILVSLLVDFVNNEDGTSIQLESLTNTFSDMNMVSHKERTRQSKIERAAIKIQAAYRGYRAREKARSERQNQNNAAVKIQSLYRGYRARHFAQQRTAAIKVVQKRLRKKIQQRLTDKNDRKSKFINK